MSEEYLIPNSITEALQMLDGKRRPIAGGTDLMVARRTGDLGATSFVDVTQIPELQKLELEEDRLLVGAGCRFSDLEVLLREKVPGLAEACHQVGSPLIRNLATLGGNLVSASPAADTVPPLAAFGATVEIVSLQKRREIPVAQLAIGPKQTQLASGELVTRIMVPIRKSNEGQAFLKLGRRRAMAISIVNGAARVLLEGRTIKEASLAIGSAAPCVIVSRSVPEILIGKELHDDLLSGLGSAVASEVKPISDLRASADYRREMCGLLARRLIILAYQRALKGGKS